MVTSVWPTVSERIPLIEVARSLEPLLRASEAEIEESRRMPAAVTDALYDGGMYRAFLPAELGGLDAHPLEWLEAVEEVSRVNGSAGWLCMLHTGSTWAEPAAMRRILAQERWITAGNIGRAGGVARRVPGGYRISGRWPFCSGSPEATYLYGLSILHDDDGAPMVSPRDGLPYFLQAYVPADQVTLHDTWDGLGLRGTGSGDISIDDVFVPRAMVNESGIWSHHYPSPLLRANFNLAAHAAHALGLAVAATEELRADVLRQAHRGSFRQSGLAGDQSVHTLLGEADARIRAARLFLQDVIRRAHDDALEHVHIDYELRVLMLEVNVFVTRECRDVVDRVFQASGAPAVFRGRRIERIYRDMMTAASHLIVAESQFQQAGQYWLTRDTEEGPRIDLSSRGYIRGPHPQQLRRPSPVTAE